MPDAIASTRFRRWRLVAGTVIALLAVVSGVVLARDEIADRLIDPAPTMPASTTSASLTAEEQTFYDFVAPRLARVSAEGNELVRLANGRSRNLVELQTRGARVESGGGEIDDFLSTHGTPSRFTAAMGDYRAGMAAIRTGTDEARAGFLSFDWDRVASAVDQFEAGAAQLTAALDALQHASGARMPSTATPATALE